MRLFLSAPFTNEFDFAARRYKDRGYPQFLEGLAESLERDSHEVYLAQREDGWGLELGPGDDDARKDLAKIRDWCDCMLVLPKGYTSLGVSIELGWASALRKRIILLERQTERTPEYVGGLAKLTRLSILRFTELGDLVEKLRLELG